MKVVEIKNVNKIYNESEVQVHAVNGVTLIFRRRNLRQLSDLQVQAKPHFLTSSEA